MPPATTHIQALTAPATKASGAMEEIHAKEREFYCSRVV